MELNKDKKSSRIISSSEYYNRHPIFSKNTINKPKNTQELHKVSETKIQSNHNRNITSKKIKNSKLLSEIYFI